MITLCEKCFPDHGKHEVYATVPHSPCEICGKFDERNGVRCHLFPRDPREEYQKSVRANPSLTER